MNSGFSGSRGHVINKYRLFAVGIFILIVLSVYIAHFFSLQVLKGSEFRKQAEIILRKQKVIPTLRGKIYDRNMNEPLVINTGYYSVYVIPAELDRNIREEVFERLARVLNMDKSKIKGKIKPREYTYYTEVEIKKNISFDVISFIAEHKNNFPGVGWHSRPGRSYSDIASLVHVIGYVGDITKEELTIMRNKGYEEGDVIGKSGVEKKYDAYLRGVPGVRYGTVDVKGKRVDLGKEEIVEPKLGNNLQLTIDYDIQKLCEKALGERTGSVLVMNPENGEILAMVSYPWFDPNLFFNENSRQIYNKLRTDPSYPFINRAIQSHYSPASTFKIIMTSMILEEGLFPEHSLINCSGTFRLGNRVSSCWKKTGHGYLDLYGGLAQSCNVYFWTIGTRYSDIDIIDSYIYKFGIGKKTGIDLPEEITGIVPTPEWKETELGEPWVGGDTANISIGQGFLTMTPLQLADAVAMIVNDGVIYQPQVMKEIFSADNKRSIKQNNPVIIHTAEFAPETLRKVRKGMRKVITEGTARYVITTDAVTVAGKTGTGEVGLEEQFHSWFSAYAPYDKNDERDPVVVVVMVEAANEWEWWAPKAANMIFHGIYSNMNYEEVIDDLNLHYMVGD